MVRVLLKESPTFCFFFTPSTTTVNQLQASPTSHLLHLVKELVLCLWTMPTVQDLSSGCGTAITSLTILAVLMPVMWESVVNQVLHVL